MPITLHEEARLPIRRGCGVRVPGGVYAMASFGVAMLHDPPIPIDPASLGLTPLGMGTFVRNGVTHLLDMVGETFYPDVAGFVAEALVHNVSRRLPVTLPLERLSPQSRVYLIHQRACVVPPRQRWLMGDPYRCPDGRGEHEGCARIWWSDIAPRAGELPGSNVSRFSGDVSYWGRTRPDGAVATPGVFLSFPFAGVEYVTTTDATRADRVRDRLRTLPVALQATVREVAG